MPQNNPAQNLELQPLLVKDVMARFDLRGRDRAEVERMLDAEESVLRKMGDKDEQIIKELEFKLRSIGAVEMKMAA